LNLLTTILLLYVRISSIYTSLIGFAEMIDVFPLIISWMHAIL